MNIVYLHQYFCTPEMAGGTRSYEMARRMVRAGHGVTMVTSRPSGERLVTREVIEGIKVFWIRVPYDNSMPYWRRMVAFVRFAVLASWVASTKRCDLVFATSTPLTIIIPAWWVKAVRRCPLVFEVRDLWPEVPIAIGALRPGLLSRATEWLERRAYQSADQVVALSPGMAEGVVRSGFPAGRVHVISNACDFDLFPAAHRDAERYRAERPWLGDRKLVLYAGTLGVINGVSYLVDVAHACIDVSDEVVFLVIGDGMERETIEQRAKAVGVWEKNFFMEPPLRKRDVSAALTAATVCTSLVVPLPALEANSANKFFDALATGRPIAINYGGWQATLIRERDMGVCLGPNPQDAAHDLLSVVTDGEMVARMGRNSGTCGKELFDRDSLALKLLAVVESAAGRS